MEKNFSYPIVTCKACGKKVIRTSNRQWWCSRNCGERFKRKLRREYELKHPKYSKICGYCNKEFVTNSSKKIFCTIKHKEKYYNELQKKLGLRTKYRHRSKCDGNWKNIIHHAGDICDLCGYESKTSNRNGLVVHHMDGNGTYMNNPNNNLTNLVVLCRKCHKLFHGLSLVFHDGKWKVKSDFLKALNWHSVEVL